MESVVPIPGSCHFLFRIWMTHFTAQTSLHHTLLACLLSPKYSKVCHSSFPFDELSNLLECPPLHAPSNVSGETPLQPRCWLSFCTPASHVPSPTQGVLSTHDLFFKLLPVNNCEPVPLSWQIMKWISYPSFFLAPLFISLLKLQLPRH